MKLLPIMLKRDVSDEARDESGQWTSSGSSQYHMDHVAPMRDSGAPMHDLTGLYPDDLYTHPHYYQLGDWEVDLQCRGAMWKARGNPDLKIRIYRACPKTVNTFNAGDWVSPSKIYAEDHGQGRDDYHVIQITVPAKELFTNGDSWAEWGWDPDGAKTKISYTSQKIRRYSGRDRSTWHLFKAYNPIPLRLTKANPYHDANGKFTDALHTGAKAGPEHLHGTNWKKDLLAQVPKAKALLDDLNKFSEDYSAFTQEYNPEMVQKAKSIVDKLEGEDVGHALVLEALDSERSTVEPYECLLRLLDKIDYVTDQAYGWKDIPGSPLIPAGKVNRGASQAPENVASIKRAIVNARSVNSHAWPRAREKLNSLRSAIEPFQTPDETPLPPRSLMGMAKRSFCEDVVQSRQNHYKEKSSKEELYFQHRIASKTWDYEVMRAKTKFDELMAKKARAKKLVRAKFGNDFNPLADAISGLKGDFKHENFIEVLQSAKKVLAKRKDEMDVIEFDEISEYFRAWEDTIEKNLNTSYGSPGLMFPSLVLLWEDPILKLGIEDATKAVADFIAKHPLVVELPPKEHLTPSSTTEVSMGRVMDMNPENYEEASVNAQRIKDRFDSFNRERGGTGYSRQAAKNALSIAIANRMFQTWGEKFDDDMVAVGLNLPADHDSADTYIYYSGGGVFEMFSYKEEQTNTVLRSKGTKSLEDVTPDAVAKDRGAITFARLDTPEGKQLARIAAVSKLVNKWAVTSNDDDYESLAMQEAARREFDLTDAAPWVHRSGSVDGAVLGVTKRFGPLYQAFLRAQYDNTQKWFASHHMETIQLYRGIKGEPSDNLVDDYDSDNAIVSLPIRPLSSWAVTPGEARSFKGDPGILYTSAVPATHILSTSLTGNGCFAEDECVVIGGRISGTVLEEDGWDGDAGLEDADYIATQAKEELIASWAENDIMEKWATEKYDVLEWDPEVSTSIPTFDDIQHGWEQHVDDIKDEAWGDLKSLFPDLNTLSATRWVDPDTAEEHLWEFYKDFVTGNTDIQKGIRPSLIEMSQGFQHYMADFNNDTLDEYLVDHEDRAEYLRDWVNAWNSRYSKRKFEAITPEQLDWVWENHTTGSEVMNQIPQSSYLYGIKPLFEPVVSGVGGNTFVAFDQKTVI